MAEGERCGKGNLKLRTLLDSLPSVFDSVRSGLGSAALLRLGPGAQCAVRCGLSNLRLTCMFGLTRNFLVHVAEEEAVEVPCGRTVVFDDSYEHSFANGSQTSACVALRVHFWHPAVPESDWSQLAAQLPWMPNAKELPWMPDAKEPLDASPDPSLEQQGTLAEE